MSLPFDANNPGRSEIQLSIEDQRLLDQLAQAGYDRSAVACAAESAETKRRLDALCNLLGLINDYPVEDDGQDTLVDATMVQIDRFEAQRTARMKFDAAGPGENRRGWRIRVPDFLTMAAVLLIAFGVCWPIVSSMRQKALDVACADNMRLVGYAFGQYANDYRGSLPVARAGLPAPEAAWDTVKNVLNLQPLIEGKYCAHGCLNCPGHPHNAGPSYSYRWFLPDHQLGWGTGRVTVVLGDLNPVLDPARAGHFLPPLSMSINHKGRGQNVISTDGAILWLTQPVVGSDNIWLPQGAEALKPGMRPEDPMDVFLVH